MTIQLFTEILATNEATLFNNGKSVEGFLSTHGNHAILNDGESNHLILLNTDTEKLFTVKIQDFLGTDMKVFNHIKSVTRRKGAMIRLIPVSFSDKNTICNGSDLTDYECDKYDALYQKLLSVAFEIE